MISKRPEAAAGAKKSPVATPSTNSGDVPNRLPFETERFAETAPKSARGPSATFLPVESFAVIVHVTFSPGA